MCNTDNQVFNISPFQKKLLTQEIILVTTIEEKTNSDFLRVTSFVCRFIDSMKKEPEN